MKDTSFHPSLTGVEQKMQKRDIERRIEASPDREIFSFEFRQAFDMNDVVALRGALMNDGDELTISEEAFHEMCHLMDQLTFDEAKVLLGDIFHKDVERRSIEVKKVLKEILKKDIQ